MYSAKFVRDNLELLKVASFNKGEKIDWEKLEELDNSRREIISFVEERKKLQKDISLKISNRKDDKNEDSFKEMVKQAKEYSDEIREREAELKEIEKEFELIISMIPNISHNSVPIGKNAADNETIKEWQLGVTPSFKVLPHWEVGTNLGIIDFPKGAKISGSFFPVFMGAGASLVRALINFMIESHLKNGFKEVWVPAVVNRDSMFSTGQIPKLEKDMYFVQEDDLFHIPTAEVPVTNLHRGDLVDEGNLPIYYVAYTPCFRREAGAYGKDTKGLMRLHQFDKVELVKFVKPETSYNELETLLSEAESILQSLKLSYRVLKLCTGDLSFSASKCYDIEVWASGTEKWLEVSSCSNFEDFQAKRGNIRYRKKSGAKEYLHTLNGSGVALPRVIIAILEQYQQPDGSVIVPEVLQKYMGGMEVIKP